MEGKRVTEGLATCKRKEDDSWEKQITEGIINLRNKMNIAHRDLQRSTILWNFALQK